MIQPGFAAIAAKYDQETADYIRSAPQRAYDDAFAYAPQGETNKHQAPELAEHARIEMERRVARAAKDTTYALDWAAKVVKSAEMKRPWNRMSLREKVSTIQEQEYEDELESLLRNLSLMPQRREPPARTFPARNRAYHEAMRIFNARAEFAP